MIRAHLLLLLAACGDNLDLGLDSTFEGGEARFFGTTAAIGPAPDLERTPLPNIEVCLDRTCGFSSDAGTFVLQGPQAPHEAVFAAQGGGFIPIAIAVIAGPGGERNVGTVPLQFQDVLMTTAAAFGDDPQLATHGGVLVLAERYDDGVIELAIDGATPRYLNADTMPDPAATQLTERAIFFGVEPGEVVLRSIVGQCEAVRDGWPGATLAEIRIPIFAGYLTLVRPQCLGG